MMRSFTTLLSTIRASNAGCRHFSTTWCLQHRHNGGGSNIIKRHLWPSCRPFMFGLDSRQFIHHSSRAMEIEIISEEYIKPSSPTPRNLRTFKLSILDQIFFPIYTPSVLFFLNSTNTNLNNVITNQSENLKTSLSHLLTHFYPLAGTINGPSEIDCNDQGVGFTKTRVKGNLVDFISQPDSQLIQRLFPKSTLVNYVVSVQVNIFDCGGIALSTSASHKLIDGTSLFTFLKAWASKNKGLSQVIYPSFIASTIFPQSHHLKNALPTKLVSGFKDTITRRFLISEIALNSLKSKVVDPPKPTRVEAASSLIWKCAARAASCVRSFRQNSPHFLSSFVDIRRRDLPKLPDESIGNLYGVATAVCFPKLEPELPTLMRDVKKSIASVNHDYISKFKGKNGYIQVDGMIEMCNNLFKHIDEGDCLTLTSLCKSGLYEIDFGWGKPVWFCYDSSGASRIVALADTSKDEGIEVTISLSSQEMAIFLCDEELLLYASMDYSPLKLFNDDSHH